MFKEICRSIATLIKNTKGRISLQFFVNNVPMASSVFWKSYCTCRLVWFDPAGPGSPLFQTTKNTHLAIYKSFETLRKFILTHEGHVTDGLLDRDKLAEFSLEGAHPSIYLAFWNFVQVAALELVPNLESLTSGATGPEIGLPTFDF